jgi:lactoylglutathione lyase
MARRVGIRIEHAAVWTADIERLRQFYAQYLGATSSPLYTDEASGFRSYFLSFTDGARLELMQMPAVDERPGGEQQGLGYAHIAVALGSAGAVDNLTARLRQDGVRVLDEPRRTGDGYYESVVLDPDGNRLELTV